MREPDWSRTSSACAGGWVCWRSSRVSFADRGAAPLRSRRTTSTTLCWRRHRGSAIRAGLVQGRGAHARMGVGFRNRATVQRGRPRGASPVGRALRGGRSSASKPLLSLHAWRRLGFLAGRGIWRPAMLLPRPEQAPCRQCRRSDFNDSSPLWMSSQSRVAGRPHQRRPRSRGRLDAGLRRPATRLQGQVMTETAASPSGSHPTRHSACLLAKSRSWCPTWRHRLANPVNSWASAHGGSTRSAAHT